MNIIYLLIFCLFGYGALLIGCKFFKVSAIYAIAIGSVVNANIFTSVSYPITVGGLTFGMNSVIYILFLFCVLIMFDDFGKKDASTLTFSSIAAIMFAAVIELITDFATGGYRVEFLIDFFSFLASSISTLVAVFLMIKLFDTLKIKKVNIYLNCFASLLVASFVDSIIYFGLINLIGSTILSVKFLLDFLALYLGKLISIAFALFVFYLIKKKMPEKVTENKKGVLVFASSNQGKIRELKKEYQDCQILSLEDIGFKNEIVEDGKTCLENALIKAKTVSEFLKAKKTPMVVLADDSGLFVDALGGKPGVHTARFSGKNATSEKNRAKLLKALEGQKNRKAYFYTCMVKYFDDGSYIVGEGKTFGRITTKEIGANNFGYDPVFYSNDLKKTFGVASLEEKSSVSHRHRAIENLKENEQNNLIKK